MIKKNDILKILEKKEIKYSIFEHEPFYTVEDSNKTRSEMKGAHTKNLFLIQGSLLIELWNYKL